MVCNLSFDFFLIIEFIKVIKPDDIINIIIIRGRKNINDSFILKSTPTLFHEEALLPNAITIVVIIAYIKPINITKNT